MKAIRVFWVNGPQAGNHLLLEAGAESSFGRDDSANTAMPWDNHTSRRHFLLSQSGEEWKLTDLKSSNGTYLNQQRIAESPLADGDLITAGATHLRVRDGDKFTKFECVLETLRNGNGQLWGVMDAARDPEILPMLAKSGEPVQSLYEGEKGRELEKVAPYLVQFTGEGPLLDSLVYGGWGKSWGIYLNCQQAFADVRRQLRRSLMVKAEGQQDNFYFRFYDPRVLRVWLPECTPQQAATFLGPITSASMEGEEDDKVIRFSVEQAGLRKQEIDCAVQEKKQS